MNKIIIAAALSLTAGNALAQEAAPPPQPRPIAPILKPNSRPIPPILYDARCCPSRGQFLANSERMAPLCREIPPPAVADSGEQPFVAVLRYGRY
jgi:hypothetical protein